MDKNTKAAIITLAVVLVIGLFIALAGLAEAIPELGIPIFVSIGFVLLFVVVRTGLE